MKKIFFIAVMLLSCFVYAQQKDVFKPLYNLAGGTWQMKTSKGFICERWKKISDNELQSVSFKVIGSDTTILEKVNLVKKGNAIYYMVKDLTGQYPADFKLSGSTNNEFIFTNPAHDFPQRVVYQFISRDSIHAFVDGKSNGKFVKQDFYYKRIK